MQPSSESSSPPLPAPPAPLPSAAPPREPALRSPAGRAPLRARVTPSARTLCHVLLDATLVAGFAAAILLPPALHVVQGGDGEGTRMEYRNPAPFPAPALDPRWPRAFERYFDDNFALRTALVRWHNRVKLLWLGASPTPTFVVGVDGWLFYTGERTIENHVGALRLTPEELERWRRVLEGRRDFCERRGITYLLVVVPDKHAIYAEKLPPVYRHPERATTADQLRAHLRGSSVEPLWLEDRLLAAREREELPLYYRLGTHWNDLGAWVGYETILERLAPRFPGLAPLERPTFGIDPAAKDDNFGSRLMLHAEMPQEIVAARPRRPLCARLVAHKEPPVPVNVWECPERRRAPAAIVFHDSQGDWLEPYLADTFSRLTMISKGAFDRELVARERPGVVIEELGERRLWRVPRR